MWKLPEFVSEEDITDKPMVLLLVLASVLQTSIMYSPESHPRLGNRDVVALLARGLPENLVLKAINAVENDFDLSSNGLHDLKRTGVSDEVICAMQSVQLQKSRER
jgi:hypothetical protein